jgi:hypothetical protein
MSQNRLQQLIDAGVAEQVSDFSNDAKHVINAMSEDEFSSLLSTRAKVFERGGQALRETFDHCVTLCI